MSPPSLGSPWPETLVGARQWGRKEPVPAGTSGRWQSAAPAVCVRSQQVEDSIHQRLCILG